MDPIIALSGDHDDDEDTRLAALNELTVDVKVDSWLHNALQLERYPDAKTQGWTEVPKALVSVALGRAMIAVGGGDEGKDEWGGPKGEEPTRFGDWEVKGRTSDF